MKTKEAAQLKVAILCKQIVECKWYQYYKRWKLFNEAKRIAKFWDIDF